MSFKLLDYESILKLYPKSYVSLEKLNKQYKLGAKEEELKIIENIRYYKYKESNFDLKKEADSIALTVKTIKQIRDHKLSIEEIVKQEVALKKDVEQIIQTTIDDDYADDFEAESPDNKTEMYNKYHKIERKELSDFSKSDIKNLKLQKSAMEEFLQSKQNKAKPNVNIKLKTEPSSSSSKPLDRKSAKGPQIVNNSDFELEVHKSKISTSDTDKDEIKFEEPDSDSDDDDFLDRQYTGKETQKMYDKIEEEYERKINDSIFKETEVPMDTLTYSKKGSDTELGGELGELINVEKQRNEASYKIKEYIDLDWLQTLSKEQDIYNHIVLQKMVGRGGEGKVYKSNTIGDRIYAVKVMEVNPNNTAFLKYIEKVIKEFKIIKKLDCKYLVKYIYLHIPEEVLTTTNSYAELKLVMDYIKGCSLEYLLTKKSLHDKNGIVAKIFYCVLYAVHYLHRNKIIHRDLKPSNILIREDSTAYLSDYGIIKEHNYNAQISHTKAIGTPLYMAPEVHYGSKYDTSVDVYSFGASLLETVTGERPYKGVQGMNSISSKWLIDLFKSGKSPYDHALEKGTIKKDNYWAEILSSTTKINPKERMKIQELIKRPEFNV